MKSGFKRIGWGIIAIAATVESIAYLGYFGASSALKDKREREEREHQQKSNEKQQKMSSNEAESQVLDDIHKLPFADQTHIPFGSLNSVAPFVSSPISVLRRAHSMLEITNRDIVFDLGCGTGDFLLFAADQANCKAVGIDIDHDVVWEGRKRADDLGLAHLIEFRISDVFEDDDWVQEATKIFVYLVPRMLAKKKLRNKFARFLSQSNRKVICYYFALPDWEPDHVDSQLNLYLYEKPYQGYLE